jgi:hypothetical protein
MRERLRQASALHAGTNVILDLAGFSALEGKDLMHGQMRPSARVHLPVGLLHLAKELWERARIVALRAQYFVCLGVRSALHENDVVNLLPQRRKSGGWSCAGPSVL